MSKKNQTTKKSSEPVQAIDARAIRYREAAFEVRGEGDEQSVRMSVSSEAPVLSYIYFNGEMQLAYEILDHAPGSVDMCRCKDGLVILDPHGGDQIGLLSVQLADRKLGGLVEFCTVRERRRRIRQDAVLRETAAENTSWDTGSRTADSYSLEGEQDGSRWFGPCPGCPTRRVSFPVPADPERRRGAVPEAKVDKQIAGQSGKETKKMEPKEMAACSPAPPSSALMPKRCRKQIDDGKGPRRA
jgi:hypothetical protein